MASGPPDVGISFRAWLRGRDRENLVLASSRRNAARDYVWMEPESDFEAGKEREREREEGASESLVLPSCLLDDPLP